MRPGPPLLYLATAGGLALTARSVAGHPAPLSVAVGCLVGYLGLVALGVTVPRMQMWGEVICHVPGGRGVALTFDDGPHPEHTRVVAGHLAKFGARATFFLIGEKTARHPDVARELVAQGHEVGVHGHRVDRLLTLRSQQAALDDTRRSVEAIEAATGERPGLFRPPYGLLTPRLVEAVGACDLEIIGWSARGLDGLARTTRDAMLRRVVPGLRDGAIVCLHDAAEHDDRVPLMTTALPALLEAASARGLPCVTVSELLQSAGR